MIEICDTCGGVLTGLRFVDGVDAAGNELGTAERYCVPCERAKYPYPRLDAERVGRVAKRISLGAAAHALGITTVALSGFEMGREQAPLDLIDRMHQLYGIGAYAPGAANDVYGFGE